MTDKVRDWLEKGNTIDTAAALAGVPRRHLLYWIEQGRLGETGFVPFVNMLDDQHTKLSQFVLEDIYARAFKDRDLAAIQFLYKHRLQKQAESFQQKVMELEDKIESEAALGTGNVLSADELAELEASVEQEEDARH